MSTYKVGDTFDVKLEIVDIEDGGWVRGEESVKEPDDIYLEVQEFLEAEVLTDIISITSEELDEVFNPVRKYHDLIEKKSQLEEEISKVEARLNHQGEQNEHKEADQ